MTDNNSVDQKDNSNDPNKAAYFIIVRKSLEKLDFTRLRYETDNKIDPIIIFQETDEQEDKSFLEKTVFKFEKKQKTKEKGKQREKTTKYKIKFFEEEKTYNSTFSLNDECFVFQPELKTGNKYLPIIEEPIKQNIVPLYKKLNIFLLALEKNNEIEAKEEKLYEDSISLYEAKKQFSLLITLFLKIYNKSKNLCSRLIKIFYEINAQENSDKIDELKKEVESFKDIYSNSQKPN